MTSYRPEELAGIYELGRLYLKMGYLVPAERIFAGLAVVDKGITPAQIGLGLVKLERGAVSEAYGCFREALKFNVFELEAKLGLSIVFIAQGEYERAKVLLNQLTQAFEKNPRTRNSLRRLKEALLLRCE